MKYIDFLHDFQMQCATLKQWFRNSIFSSLDSELSQLFKIGHTLARLYGPPQVKCRLLSSSIFDAMNFQHFLEMLEHNF